MIFFHNMAPFLEDYVWPTLILIFWAIVTIVPLLLSVAYLTFFERKVIGYMQLRTGPNVTGPLGLLQPIADAVKLMHKETIIPHTSNKFAFLIAPIIIFTVSIGSWAVVPWSELGALANINVGILYLLALSSLGVYGVIIAGWASNSRYALLGALRAAAQMISYEISIGLVILSIVVSVGSLNLNEIIKAQQSLWFIIPHFPMAVIFLITALAETNRAPFDLAEAETELVAGFHVEYSSISFALFFLSEYANMILMSALGSMLFLGGWLAPCAYLDFIPGVVWFALKIALFLFFFLWARATLPRYRYDQLMRLGWKVLLPVSLAWFFCTSLIIALWG